MNWFFIALAAPFLWALVNIADNYLVSRFSQKEKERSSGALALFASVVGIFIAFTIWVFMPNVFNIPFLDKTLLTLAGALTIVWILMYLFALEIEDTSAVVPWFLAIPITGYILGYFFLGETLSFQQLVGSSVIFSGLIIISIDFSGEKKKFKHKPALYMLCASIAVATSGIIFKYVTIEGNFWVSSFWEYLGVSLTGILIYLLVPHYRANFHQMNKTGGFKILVLNVVTELMSISGNLLTNLALLLAPVTMVYLVGSFQPAIVLFLTIVGTKFFPHIVKENISKKALMPKVIAIVLMTIGSMLLLI
ncbi:MAG: EamA family transporter [Candidatus Paceibacterota bacterium]